MPPTVLDDKPGRTATVEAPAERTGRIVVVGCPNVGKSALFNRLTGRYVSVSNYPGTTIGISHGKAAGLEGDVDVVDTPGMYSLSPITDEERVALQVLSGEPASAVLHVVDAKNLDRMLPLTLQLIEAGLPVMLVLNMADEARRVGVEIDSDALEQRLGIPVVWTTATKGEGLDELRGRLDEAAPVPDFRIDCGEELEAAIDELKVSAEVAPGVFSARTRVLLALQDDAFVPADDEAGAAAGKARTLRQGLGESAQYTALVAARREAGSILDGIVEFPDSKPAGLRERLGRLCMHPVWGVPVLLAVLYFGLYKFVGGFGAGTMVDYLEGTVFEGFVNPWFESIVHSLIPWATGQSLLVGEYGVLTLGLRYAIAIILPIVGTFFLAFSILEDSGYLPRLAMLVDRLFKKLGLNGRAVIPMVLGLGCDTMGTMVTRTLETRREKMIASMLLALAIPCSAQIGVILGLLSGHAAALLVWAGVITGVFLAAGGLAGKLLPGEGPALYLELPPLRLPKIANVAVKTYSRMVWYLKEVLPLFLLASVVIWLGQLTGVFAAAVRALEPVVRMLGLPADAAVAFLFGFFRRDYGAAGLYDLQQAGALTGTQLAVAAITLTLFLPCIAQFLVLRKERGWPFALATSAGIVVVAFGVGATVNLVLTGLGVTL